MNNCGSDAELLWARTPEQIKSDNARGHDRASILPSGGLLAVGAESIMVETCLTHNGEISRFLLIGRCSLVDIVFLTSLTNIAP
jgi:hypothetical protein